MRFLLAEVTCQSSDLSCSHHRNLQTESPHIPVEYQMMVINLSYP